MKPLFNPSIQFRLRFYANITSGVAIFVSLATLLGWLFDIVLFKSILPGLVTMKINTALCFLLAGISLLFLNNEESQSQRKRIGSILASIVVGLGLLTLIEYLFNWNMGIDQFFLPDTATSPSAFPGRMSQVTAICFTLLGAALLLINTQTSQYFSVSVILLSVLAIIGYLFNFESLYRLAGYGSMALHTAVTFLVLSTGILAARPMHVIMKVLTSNLSGGRTIRFMLPLTILLLIFLGWLVERGESLKILNAETKTVVLIILIILIYVPLFYFNARNINHSEETLQRSEQMLRLFVEHAPASVAMFDREMKYIVASHRYLVDYRLVDQNIIGQSHYSIFPEIPERWMEIYQRALTGTIQSAYEDSFQRGDGTLEWVRWEIHPWYANSREIGGIILFSELITERKEAEAQIEYQANLLGHVNDAVVAVDSQFRISAWNRAAETMYGWSASEALGTLSTEIMRSEMTAEERQEVLTQLRELGMYKSELIQYRKDGGTVYVDTSTISLYDNKGQPNGIVSVNRDITARKQAEEKLRESEELFAKAFYQSPVGIVLTDLTDQTIRDVNDSLLEMIGLTRAQVADLKTLQLNVQATPQVRTIIDQELQQHGVFRNQEVKLPMPNGQLRDFLNSGASVVIGGKPHCLDLFQDITERKYAEEQINRQLQKIKSLRYIDLAIGSSFNLNTVLNIVLQQVTSQLNVDAATVLLFDPPTSILKYAHGMGFKSSAIEHTQLMLGEGLTGRAALERTVLRVDDLSQVGNDFKRAGLLKTEAFVSYCAISLVAKGELQGVLEVFHRAELHPDQEWLDFFETLGAQAAVAVNNAQLFNGLQRSKIELEERVAERTLQLNHTNAELAQANRAKDEFLANMSHELRTPLNSILGLSESLLEQDRNPFNESQKKSLQIIESSGRHLLVLISDILDLSKIEAGKLDYHPQPVDVNELCQSSLFFIKSQATKKSIVLNYDNKTFVEKVFADPHRLKQILINLLSNAVKFTPDKGTVTLEVRSEQEIIQFSVIDTGIGIANTDLQRLFTPFVQLDSSLSREFEGTGLGLALAQKLTDMHGGSIHVESEVGKGSRFTVNLQITEDRPEQLEDIHLLVDDRGKGNDFQVTLNKTHYKILLAEDNIANIVTFGEYLKAYGYEIVVAHDGLEAIDKVRESSPDIILMDIQMPLMNGLEAIKHIRADPYFASTPIIALTALAMVGDRERCLEAGATEYLSKPVSLKVLRQMIESFLAAIK